ncbi:hypothetical protein [Ekhidna sp.]
MTKNTFIVGDAGGTGTQWRLVKGEDITQFETVGFNAYTHDINDLIASMKEVFGDQIMAGMPLYLYAAGVDTDGQAAEVRKALTDEFATNTSAFNDLVGVARSLCGKEKGNVCILGTGSNACYYDGEAVNKVGASLGYVLGDEGSGAHLGKKLMQGVFRGKFSEELIALFQKRYNTTSHDVIERIYNQPKPNHFLASFALFVFENRNQPEIHQLISDNFTDFFEAFFGENIDRTDPFYFSGSIAYYFSDILREIGQSIGIVVKNIVQSPISGLVLYHQRYD